MRLLLLLVFVCLLLPLYSSALFHPLLNSPRHICVRPVLDSLSDNGNERDSNETGQIFHFIQYTRHFFFYLLGSELIFFFLPQVCYGGETFGQGCVYRAMCGRL